MTTIHAEYNGNLRSTATHIQSNCSLITDAPTDNNGKGESFSPTDLVATALGTCIMTIMGIYAQNNNFSLKGTKIDITKTMNSSPRRIGKIEITFTMPKLSLSDQQKKEIEDTATCCPVCLSLHPELEKDIKFIW